MNQRLTSDAISPGVFISRELEARGWKQIDLAQIMGTTARAVNELVKGKRRVTTKSARELADAFGSEPEEWLALQAKYDLALDRLPADNVRKRKSKLWNMAPIREMLNRGWLVQTESIDFLEAQVKQFFHQENLGERTGIVCAARKSSDYGNISLEQEAWFQRAFNLADTVPVSTKYTKSSFESLRTDLRKLLGEVEEIRHIPRMLSEYGVRLLIVEHLPSTKIDGVCFWLDKSSPVIVLSMRYNRIDWFWFTLMHELAHVFYGHGQAESSIDILLVGKDAQSTNEKPDEEKQADLFAEDFLIERKQLNSLLGRSMGIVSDASIWAFAKTQGIHAGIVIGRLQHMDKIPYRRGRNMLVQVRDVIVNSALTDGWGYSLEM
ncbi:MAG: HigA family addiction module antitoxin [Candidatus Zixiibacteriota bacterium]